MCRVSDYVDGKCADGINFWAYIIVFQFVLLMKLVLMTVLFALFNATGARIAAETDSIWKFQRYKLIINFSNTLRLPPPLNICSILIIICKFIINCCRKGASFLKREKKSESDEEDYSTEYSSYWKQFANNYYTSKTMEKEEDSYVKKELDVLSQLCDDLQVKEMLIYRTKAQIKHLASDICYTHVDLETLKYHARKEDAKAITLHSLSRESPYPETKIQRFLVPDKYVPWDVTWLHYEPIFYTMPKEKFSQYLQPYVDDDLVAKREKGGEYKKPAFKWNMESTDANKVYRNRKSWITDRNGQPITYKLDKFDLPRNPMGRTGLRGRGSLPRWGPNHNVFAIITRYKKKSALETEEDLIETSDDLEFVEMWFMKKKSLSLPGGPAWSENRYEVIQSCFKADENAKNWENSEEMTAFFKAHAMDFPNVELTNDKEDESTEKKFTCNLVYHGYMDDQLNTDQAWKEVELWHIHYNIWTNLVKKFKANISWKLLSEYVFTQLPYGQTVLIQNTLKHLIPKYTI